MTPDTWAIAAATFLGPIFAIIVTFWHQERSSKYNRRLHLFRTLMSTRRIDISIEHVNAINLIEVDFYGYSKIEEKWKIYKDHLNDNTRPEDDAWREKKERLLAQLLFEIAQVLRFKIPALEIFKGGYAPSGWLHRDARYFGALEYIHELSEAKKVLPIWVTGVTQPPSQPEKSIEPTSQNN